MVKVNNGTKIMVNRAIELLNAKIAHAQSRHIPKRMPVARLNPCNLDVNVMKRERQKCEKYDLSKRLSMWEQDKLEVNQLQDPARLDQSHYKHCGLNERNYDCTWIEFPSKQPPKPQPAFTVEEHIPYNRRKSGFRPETAKPWDAESSDFLKQWDNDNVKINRNRYATAVNSNPSALQRHLAKVKVSRKQFHY
ncbi:hypothetical protein KR093_004492 [Drosophila rubida]|uniref:Uncharacterized protein n=1 Tax=Drosophila rubida TaxID=30044 RepID=A0AAD4JT77_9MUSC|nr:hypothetical protein KR093_004492 [Drosophila rubida]